MKIHNKVIKSTTVAEKTDLWGNFIIAILTRTGLHNVMTKFVIWITSVSIKIKKSPFQKNTRSAFGKAVTRPSKIMTGHSILGIFIARTTKMIVVPIFFICKSLPIQQSTCQ